MNDINLTNDMCEEHGHLCYEQLGGELGEDDDRHVQLEASNGRILMIAISFCTVRDGFAGNYRVYIGTDTEGRGIGCADRAFAQKD